MLKITDRDLSQTRLDELNTAIDRMAVEIAHKTQVAKLAFGRRLDILRECWEDLDERLAPPLRSQDWAEFNARLDGFLHEARSLAGELHRQPPEL